MKVHEIREALAARTRQMRELLTAANGGELSSEARTKFDTLETEARGLQERLGREERIAEMERQATATPIGSAAPDLARAVENFRTAAFIAHISGIAPGLDVAREMEVAQEFSRRSGNGDGYSVPLAVFMPPREKRTLVYGGGSGSGAGLVFEQELPDAIGALRPATIVGGLGARILDGLTGGPVSTSKITTGKTAAFIAENSAGTPSDPATDKVQMQPHHAIALTSLSRNMLVQSSAAAQALINEDIAASIFGAIDRVALAGGGANEPSGVWDTITSSALNDPFWESILGMIEQTEIANVPGARLGFAAHPSVVRKLRSTPKLTFGSPPTDGMGGFVMEQARQLADYALATSTFVPTVGSPVTAAGLIYADWSQMLVGVWESVTLAANPFSETQFRSGGVELRAIASVDVALRYDEAFQTRTVAI